MDGIRNPDQIFKVIEFRKRTHPKITDQQKVTQSMTIPPQVETDLMREGPIPKIPTGWIRSKLVTPIIRNSINMATAT